VIIPYFVKRKFWSKEVLEKQKNPIFWSGSSSFETLILTDFYHDRFVVNFITAAEGKEGMRYVDMFDVPNAVYHLHNVSDLSEVTIWI